MKVVLEIVPVACGVKSKSGKVQVCAIVVDDVTALDPKSGMFVTNNVSAPQILNFWTKSDIASSFSASKAVQTISHVTVDRGNNLNVRIAEIYYNGAFVPVGGVVEEDEEE